VDGNDATLKQERKVEIMLGFLGLEVLILTLFGGLISLLCLVLWIWMLIDCLTNHGIQGSEKVAWVLVIVLLPFLGR